MDNRIIKHRFRIWGHCLALGLMVMLMAVGACAEELTDAASSPAGPVHPPLIPVEFHLEAPAASSVNWASTVNEWDPAANPLTGPDRQGMWNATIEMPPGIHQYKYVVDGSRWMLDPRVPSVMDGGIANSLVVVGTTVERESMAAYRNVTMRDRARKLLGGSGSLPGYNRLYRPFTFCVLGDSREQFLVYKWILEAAAAHQPRFIVNTGDLVEHPDRDRDWEQFLSASSGLTVPLFVAWGNHEYRGDEWAPFLNEFVDHPGNKLYYAFQVENSLFVFLNTEMSGQMSRIMGAQLDWLERLLDGRVADHVFVFLHRPLWPCPHGKHHHDCCDSCPEEYARLIETLAKGGVTTVFTGHDHLYHRSVNNGLLQVITGGAGAPLYAKEEKGGFYHYIKVTVDGPRVKAEVYGGMKPEDGLKLKDSFTTGEMHMRLEKVGKHR